MDKKKRDFPAFPLTYNDEHYSGLTKREYIAAMAMQGMLSNDVTDYSEIPDRAVRLADKLLDLLEKQ